MGKMDAIYTPLMLFELSLKLEALDVRFERVDIRFERRESEVGIGTQLPRRQLLNTARTAG